jgi:lipopolysaccharide exporter
LAFSFSKRWLQSGVFSLLNRLMMVFFGFLNVFFMVRLLPKSDIGVWSLFVSVTTILELLRNGFIRNPMITHLVSANSEEERGRIITASWILHSILVVFSSLILFIAAGPLTRFWEAPQLDFLFYIYIARGLALIPCLQFEYLQQSHGNFRAIFFSNLARHAPTAIYIMIKFYQVGILERGVPPTLMDIAVIQLLSTVVSVWVGYIFSRGYTAAIPGFDKKSLQMLSSYGKYTLGTTISSMVIKNTDSWMIGRMISTQGVASYNPALRLSNLIEVPTLAVASLVFPQVHKKMEQAGNKGVQDIYIKSVSIILAMMLPVVIPLYIFSDVVITLIFTEQYIEAAPILRVTLFFTLLIPFNRQFGTVMDALKKPKINFYLLLMMGVLNVVTNYFFIREYGAIGAAYGTLLAYVVIFLLNQIILYKIYNISTFKVIPAVFYWYKAGVDLIRTRTTKSL